MKAIVQESTGERMDLAITAALTWWWTGPYRRRMDDVPAGGHRRTSARLHRVPGCPARGRRCIEEDRAAARRRPQTCDRPRRPHRHRQPADARPDADVHALAVHRRRRLESRMGAARPDRLPGLDRAALRDLLSGSAGRERESGPGSRHRAGDDSPAPRGADVRRACEDRCPDRRRCAGKRPAPRHCPSVPPR